ncbi:peptidylprolyl isomerase [Rhodobium gokarnense]|uniref:Parvulin-like PPIase n=1 Tax=Rhodobium gokarnense TaxID=364296 RepID=A0ABT3H8S5_9HYPH|nr:peptidylprolyl isomerase [Rhodobium gokarnense]MCW2306802.1 peptidyl-prolyl cis-trans isomerase C [Rhodobium gokarnense]
MPSRSRVSAALSAAFLLLATPSVMVPASALAEDAAVENNVLAKVGDGVIRESDLAFMAEDFLAELRRVPEDQRRPILVSALIDMLLMSQAAEKQGLAESEAFKTRMNFLKMRALRDAYVQENIAGAIDEAAIKARYDKDTADFEASEELKARHILVKTEDEAKDIIKQLDDGADFAALAKEKSTGPSGPNGGDLGFFTKGRMVKEFEDAAFQLAAGEYTKEPVQTQFGWHVIKVEERRKQEPPAFDQVKDRIRESLMREKYIESVAKLKEDATIERLDEAAKKSE